MKGYGNRRKDRGFALLLFAITLPAFVAMIGVSVDLGRVYVAKTELQTFADNAALVAAFELDGTQAGLTSATNVAANGPGTSATRNRWQFGAQAVPTPTVEFATTPNGTYSANPLSPTGMRFVRVTLAGPVPVYFLRVIPSITASQTVTAMAVAGQGLENSIGAGVDPFSPDAQNPTDPNFGYTPGVRYTLKWAPPGQRNKSGGRCAGDASFDPGGGSSDRGYIDVGQGNGNSALYDVIVNNSYYNNTPLTIGSSIVTVNGNKHVGPALDMRFSQDTDTSSTTGAAYNGNGRRIMIVAVNNGQSNGTVVGFGRFLLQSDSCSTNQKPCCATYLGNSVVAGSSKPQAAGGPGLYRVKLFQ